MKQEIWRDYRGRRQGRPGRRLLERGVLARPGRAITAEPQPGKCCDTGCTPPTATTMVALPSAPVILSEAKDPDAGGRDPCQRYDDKHEHERDAFDDFHRRSLEGPRRVLGRAGATDRLVRPFDRVCDYDKPPFAKWFVGGQTNLCHNAIDRHLAARPDDRALIYVSTETDQEHVYSFRELHAEVMCMAAILRELGVGQGDRVLVYMPMIAQAVFVMLACARIGAIHSVVFGGFASGSLANRIDNATPTVIVSADAGSRNGKVVAYKPLLDDAMRLASAPARKGLARRSRLGADGAHRRPRRGLRARCAKGTSAPKSPCVWVDASPPSYTSYTSGTTGKPKGVQRDTGGYAVALAASMKHIFCGHRARPTSRPAISAGSSATATSSTDR